jgi:hypothetical protein
MGDIKRGRGGGGNQNRRKGVEQGDERGHGGGLGARAADIQAKGSDECARWRNSCMRRLSGGIDDGRQKRMQQRRVSAGHVTVAGWSSG